MARLHEIHFRVLLFVKLHIVDAHLASTAARALINDTVADDVVNITLLVTQRGRAPII